MLVKSVLVGRSTKREADDKQLEAEICSNLENQLYARVRNFLLLSQMLACAPAGSHRAHSAKKHSTRRLLQVLHCCWCLVLFALLTFFVYSEYTQHIARLPTVQKSLYSCEYFVYLVHVVLIMAKCFQARHEFRSFLHVFLEIDCRLLQFGAPPEYWRFSRFCSVHYWPLLAQFVCTLAIGYYHCNESAELWHFVRSTVSCMLPNSIVYASLLQYFGLLHGIARRAALLTEVLQAELSRGGSSSEMHNSLQRLREICARLDYFTKQANDIFGPSVLLTYLGSFMNISVGLFLSYKFMDGARDAKLTWTLYSLLWALINIGKIFLVLYYNHRVQSQKSVTELILNNIKSENIELQETIKRFILQLHIDTRSSVVCGVVVLNLDFIKSLLLAQSTLFIFLLQYHEVTSED